MPDVPHLTRAKRLILDHSPRRVVATLRRGRGKVERRLRVAAQERSRRQAQQWYLDAVASPLREDVVFYESFSGNGMLCNPEAIFRGLLEAPDQQHLQHVWALKDVASHTTVLAEFRGHPRVRFVEMETADYYRALQTSKYLVNNATFPNAFMKRDGQVYVNTWHGTPLKRMGYDVVGGAVDARNVLRNFVSADYLLSTGDFMSDQMYLTAYRLTNVFTGAIVEEGYPRIDRQSPTGWGRSAREQLAAAGIDVGDRKIVLYAPTWRGESFYRPTADVDRLQRTVAQIQAVLPADEYVVLLKAHQVVHASLAERDDVAGYLVPNSIPSNALLGECDLLVSDYSSIFFDYLATRRPIFFHVPDVSSYEDDRGLYQRPDELPGPMSTTTHQLLTQLQDYLASGRTGFEDAVEAAAQRYCSREDGRATERIIDICFRGREDGYRVRRGFTDGRERILVYLGGMLTNGITTSALNMLRTIDHTRYDVTATFAFTRDPAKTPNVATIDPAVRVMPRQAGLNRSALAKAHESFIRAVADGADVTAWEAHQPAWAAEFRRTYGCAQFDQVVDFSGYSAYWASLMLGHGGPATIWQHNDLRADAEREVNGERPHQANLEGVFCLYPRFRALVSVSDALADINRENLSDRAPGVPFLAARNTMDATRILDGALGPRDDRRLSVPADASWGLTESVAAVARAFGTSALRAEAERQELISTHVPRRGRTFVTVGRLSPEKNHRRLVEAFALVHATHPESRLVIVGNGPLRSEIAALVAERGLGGAVALTGALNNPYAVMGASDCFVLSSDYEGQPMVILEARVLGLPVISTRFDSAAGAVPPGAGRLTARDSSALAEAMVSFLEDGIAIEPFDVDAYNAEVRRELDAVIGRVGRGENTADETARS